MAAYSSTIYSGNIPAATGHGPYQQTAHLHATVALPAGMLINDTINFGYIPRNAVVAAVVLKAQTQLDSNGAPTLTFDTGVTGTPQLFKAAVITVGRAVGATVDFTIAGAGYLYKNLSGAKQAVIGTCHAASATGVAGVIELDLEYFVEDAVGSPA